MNRGTGYNTPVARSKPPSTVSPSWISENPYEADLSNQAATKEFLERVDAARLEACTTKRAGVCGLF
jgi:hypothetical protein